MNQTRIVLVLTAAAVIVAFMGLFPKGFQGDFKPNIRLGLDLQGGSYLKYEVDVAQIPLDKDGKPKMTVAEAVNRAMEVIRNRVDSMGLKEPLLQREGERWIVVQLPGDKDPERTQKIIGETAVLKFQLVAENVTASDFTDESGNVIPLKVPEELEVLTDRKDGRKIALEKKTLMKGDVLKTAFVDYANQQLGRRVINFELLPEGAASFAEATEENVGRQMAIVLDGVVQSAPVIKSRIGGGKGIIEGDFSKEEANDLALVLRSGALPVPLKVINKSVVGPTLGADNIHKGIQACLLGGMIAILFMALYYRYSGCIADLALALNLFFIMGFLAWMKATLTMPGIAGLILTMGMATDFNIIIFERIREELKAGKTVRAAVDSGYNNAMSAVVDSSITTIIAALVLFNFGTGPIKGFAVTFLWGQIFSFFTAVSISKAFFDLRKHYDTLSI